MPKFIVKCESTDISKTTLEEILDQVAKKQLSCKFETLKQVQARLKSGQAETKSQAIRQIARETDQKPKTVEKRVQRAEAAKKEEPTKAKNVGKGKKLLTQSTTKEPEQPAKWGCTKCGGTFPMDQTECNCPPVMEPASKKEIHQWKLVERRLADLLLKIKKDCTTKKAIPVDIANKLISHINKINFYDRTYIGELVK